MHLSHNVACPEVLGIFSIQSATRGNVDGLRLAQIVQYSPCVFGDLCIGSARGYGHIQTAVKVLGGS